MISAFQQKNSYKWLYHWTGWTTIFAILTFFGPLFPLYCSALRMSKTQIGFILSLLPLSYLLSIFISSWIVRRGIKKIMLRFYLLRYLCALLLPLAVWVAKHYGDRFAFMWVLSVVLLFAIFRAVAETGWSTWLLELISARARGRVEAINSIVSNIGAAAASIAAVWIMKSWPGMAGYNIAIFVGIFFGFVGLFMGTRLPGGEPQVFEKKNWDILEEIGAAIGDSRFRNWSKGVGLTVIAGSVLGFLPLYLSERIGFAPAMVMLFSGCFQAGMLSSAFFWGWSADRFGSKPIFMSALAGICLFPVLLFLLPRAGSQSVVITGAIYAFVGIAFQGFIAGSSRYYYVTVLPTTRNPAFCAGFNISLQNIVAAICSFFFGWILDAMQSVSYEWRFLHVDNFTPLFALMLVCYMGAACIFRKATDDRGVRTGEFVSLFFHGNPVLAFSSIVRYHLSEDEAGRMELTRRMGDAKSHLTVEELLQALNDPSFNVRYEAIVSMARMPPDAKLIEALSAVVRRREPGLSEAAAWALGRGGDQRAVPVLREMMKCEYALLRSQCARSLAKLNDQASAADIAAALAGEKHDNIRANYAAALGRLRRAETLPDLLALLRRLKDDGLRGEVALAVAQIMGGEHRFVKLWRGGRSDFETTCAEELASLARRLRSGIVEAPEFRDAITEAARHFEQRNSDAGADALRRLLALLPVLKMDSVLRLILQECQSVLETNRGVRGDYILLALSALHAALVHLARGERKKSFSPGDAEDNLQSVQSSNAATTNQNTETEEK